MTRNNIVTALRSSVFALILLALQATPALSVNPCPEGYDSGPNWKNITSGGGGYSCYPTPETVKAQQACEAQGNTWKYPRQCIDTRSGGVGGGSTDCGPGYSYHPESGCRKIKVLKSTKPPVTSGGAGGGDSCASGQYNSQGRCIKILKSTKPPATSGGVGGGGDAEAASGPGHSPNGGGGGGDGD